MGMLNISTWGSFPIRDRSFGAMERGHAHAVAEAITFLADEVMPEAIERDHRLHERGDKPRQGFDRRLPAGASEAGHGQETTDG